MHEHLQHEIHELEITEEAIGHVQETESLTAPGIYEEMEDLIEIRNNIIGHIATEAGLAVVALPRITQ